MLDLSDKKEWPALTINTSQQTQVITIVTCALLDEAINPGVFTRKLEEGCTLNKLPPTKYKLEPNTAQNFFESVTGAKTKQSQQPTLMQPPSASSTPRTSTKKYDTKRRTMENNTSDDSMDQISNLQEGKKLRQEELGPQRKLFQSPAQFNPLGSIEQLLPPNNQTITEKYSMPKPNSAQTLAPNTSSIGQSQTYTAEQVAKLAKLQQELASNPIKTQKAVSSPITVTTKGDLNYILNLLEAPYITNNPRWVKEMINIIKPLINEGINNHLLTVTFITEPLQDFC